MQSKLILDRFLPYRLSVASNAVSARISNAYRRRFGLKITEWRLLAILAEQERATPASLGDATYGVYLIHPVVFFGLAFLILPALGLPAPSQWALSLRLLLGVGVLGAVFALALLSERYFERPLREWSKSRRSG